MSQNADETIAVLAFPLFVVDHSRRYVFIHQFGQPRDFGSPGFKAARILESPQAADARTQHTILGGYLGEIEARVDANLYVSGGDVLNGTWPALNRGFKSFLHRQGRRFHSVGHEFDDGGGMIPGEPPR